MEWNQFSSGTRVVVEPRPSGLYGAIQKWLYCLPCWEDMGKIREGSFNLLAHLAAEKEDLTADPPAEIVYEPPDPDEGLYLLD